MSDLQDVVVETTENVVEVSETTERGPPGEQGAPGSGGDLNEIWNQSSPSAMWIVTHSLNKFPSVTVVDSAGSPAAGIVSYDSLSQLTIDFDGAIFSGRAFLN